LDIRIKDQCPCTSKTSEICCLGDGSIRKVWLARLEKEHKQLRSTSKKIAGKFKLFSNPQRVEILLMLKQREHCMDEMAKKLKIPKPALSYHLGLLRKHGHICVKKRSRFAFYSLSHSGNVSLDIFNSI
jgi:DNA-binding transcriptional ArsR family regulator